MLFILGTQYLYLGVLRCVLGLGMRLAYSSLVLGPPPPLTALSGKTFSSCALLTKGLSQS